MFPSHKRTGMSTFLTDGWGSWIFPRWFVGSVCSFDSLMDQSYKRNASPYPCKRILLILWNVISPKKSFKIRWNDQGVLITDYIRSMGKVKFSQVLNCSQGVCLWMGVCLGRRSALGGGFSMEEGLHGGADPSSIRKAEGGTHPTGMYSCYRVGFENATPREKITWYLQRTSKLKLNVIACSAHW